MSFLRTFKILPKPQIKNFVRNYQKIVMGTEDCSTPLSRGLVLGVYADDSNPKDSGLLTPAAAKYNEV